MKTARFNLRAEDDQRKLIERAAKKSGDTVTRFILRSAIAEAKSVLAGSK